MVSPFRRTQETIEPYLKKRKIKFVVSDLTAERNAGIFAGKNKGSIRDYCLAHNIQDTISFKPKKGESILEVYQRAKKFLDYLNDKFKDKSVLLCGHINFLTCLDIAINGEDISKFYSFRSLKNGEIKEYIS